MSRAPKVGDPDELAVIWEWHRGLLRRATLGLTLFTLLGALAAIIGVQPISHHDDQRRLLALAEIHRAELNDFHAVANIEYALHFGAKGNVATDVLEPFRAQLRRIEPAIVREIDPRIETCLPRWDKALNRLQAPISRPLAHEGFGGGGGASSDSAPQRAAALTGAEQILLEDLVSVREGLSAEPQAVKFATRACTGPTATRLKEFCQFFASIRDVGLTRYEAVADNYTPPTIQRLPLPRDPFSAPVEADRCLNAPDGLAGYGQVAARVDGAALVRTLGDFDGLGGRISSQLAALAQQNGGVIAGSPGGFLTVSLSQRMSYLALTGFACLALIYGHYNLRRLGDLLARIPNDAAHATYRLWPHFAPVFMSPVASVQFDRPVQGGPVASWTYLLFQLLDWLPAASFFIQPAAALWLAIWIRRNPPAAIGLDAALLGVSAMLAVQLLVLTDYLRERGVIAAWIAARNQQIPKAPNPSQPIQGDHHAT